jgi:Fe-S-cluster containining protein
MYTDLPIQVLDCYTTKSIPANDAQIIGLELAICGTPLKFHLAAVGEARLADIVPAARTICGTITETILGQLRLSGVCPPCRKGCTACCNYIVPLSAPEVFQFRREVFPKAKYSPDNLLRTYLLAARRLTHHRPPQDALANADDLSGLSQWYASLNLACPFLYSGQCVIYHQRPLACREHFVTGSARGCRGSGSKTQVIELPVRMGNILCRLTKELCAVDDTVLMPLALAWYEENKSLDQRTWPAAAMADLLVEIVQETVCEIYA